MKTDIYIGTYSPLAYPAMVNRSKRQLHESVQKAMKEPTAQQLDAIKALFFLQKKDTFSVLPTGQEKAFKIFQAGYNGTAS